jgi:hypothetical protein
MVGDGAWASASPTAHTVPAAASTTRHNNSPLSPGQPASIRQAQGTGGVLLGAAVTGAIFAAMLLLVDGDDSGPLTASGTAE